MKKPESKKQSKLKKLNILAIVLCTILLSILSFIVWLFTHNDSYYSYDKAKVEARARELLYAIDEPNGLIYSGFEDTGCVESAQGWLGRHIACSYTGKRIYKFEDASSLHALDSKLRGLGFQPADAVRDKPSEHIDKPTGSFQIPYNVPGEALVVRLVFAESNDEPNLRTYLGLPKSVKIDGDAAVYGLEIGSPYWGCSNFPCPNPPSMPHKN